MCKLWRIAGILIENPTGNPICLEEKLQLSHYVACREVRGVEENNGRRTNFMHMAVKNAVVRQDNDAVDLNTASSHPRISQCGGSLAKLTHIAYHSSKNY